MSLDQIHQELRYRLEHSVGVAVSYQYLGAMLEEQISRIGKLKVLQNMPGIYPGLAISCIVNPGNISVQYGSGSSGFLLSAAIDIAVHILHQPSDVLGQHQVSYSSGELLVKSDPRAGGKLGFSGGQYVDYRYTLGSDPADLGVKLQAVGLVKPNGDPDFDKYRALTSGMFLVSGQTIFRAIADAIPFPEINLTMMAFKLTGDIQFLFTRTHFVIYSETVDFPGGICPFGGSSIREIEATRTPNSTNGKPIIEIKQDNSSQDMLDKHNNAAKSSPKPPYPSFGPHAIIYYYPRKILLDYSFGKLKPSLTYSDGGNFAGIKWYYAITAAISDVNISFQQISRTEATIIVDCAFEIYGQAGAAVSIGCIDYSVANVSCRGNVDPFTFVVKGGYETKKKELYLTTQLAAIDPRLDWTTGYGFPFDQIADWLLDEVVEKQSAKMVGAKMDIFRVSLADLGIMTYVDPYLNYLSSSAGNDSVVYSISPGDGVPPDNG